jgi:DNA processing protein
VEDVLRVLEGLGGLHEPERRTWRGPVAAQPDAALQDRLAELLSPTPVSPDDLVRAAGAPAPAVFAALVELSLAGRAVFGLDGMVSRS